MKSEIVKADFKNLNKFIKSMHTKYVVDVGIMGNKASRKSDELTNAEIGAIHEFGTNQIPPRSFLRMPLRLKSSDILAKVRDAGALKKLGSGNVVQVLKDLGVACEGAILEAFGSAGFGHWAPNAPSTIAQKHSDAPLIDTGQLRRSISSVVHTA